MRQQIVFIIALILMVSCTQAILPTGQLSHDPTLEELIFSYKTRRHAMPPLKGLMKVTIIDQSHIEQGFWAKWRSRKGVVEINGYTLLGGTLFTLNMDEETISFVSSESNFKGSRPQFQTYLMEQQDTAKMQMEWVTLLDWIARGGVPDLSLEGRLSLAEENRQMVLSSLHENGNLAQKLFIERGSLNVKKGIFFDSEGTLQAEMILSDYRPVQRSAQKTFFPFYIQTKVQDRVDQKIRQMEIVFKELKVMAE